MMTLDIIAKMKRWLRSHRTIDRLHRAWSRNRAVAALKKTGTAANRMVVPFDLAPLFPQAASHHSLYSIGDLDGFETVMVESERLADVDPRMLRVLRESFRGSFVGEPFALFVRGGATAPIDASSLSDLLDRMRLMEVDDARGFTPHRPQEPRFVQSGSGIAIAMTTFERPAALARSLPQAVALGVPVLVVDDGSKPHQAATNRTLCEKHGARYLLLPGNRGLPTAMNVALDYWLADPDIEWISYLQDDVDVSLDLLDALRPLQDKDRTPLLTGFDAADHPTVVLTEIGGRPVKTKRTTPAVHLHGHRDYWASLMPIPTPYLGAPKPRIGASLEDWWITCHAPSSVEKRGLLVPCIPGLVTTFLTHRDDSTWDNPSTGQS